MWRDNVLFLPTLASNRRCGQNEGLRAAWYLKARGQNYQASLVNNTERNKGIFPSLNHVKYQDQRHHKLYVKQGDKQQMMYFCACTSLWTVDPQRLIVNKSQMWRINLASRRWQESSWQHVWKTLHLHICRKRGFIKESLPNFTLSHVHLFNNYAESNSTVQTGNAETLNPRYISTIKVKNWSHGASVFHDMQ